MIIRMLGAALTFFSGALYAAAITKEHRRKEVYLEELILVLDHFAWELQTNLTPLCICCRAAARCGRGMIGQLMDELAQKLEQGTQASPAACIDDLLSQQDIPKSVQCRLSQLGDTLGRYDLSGQISGIHAVQELCRRDLQALAQERSKSLKSCRVVGLCTGAAVAILLL